MKTLHYALSLCLIGFSITACNNDDDIADGGGEEELITTVSLTLADGGTITILTFRDLDGPGGTDAVVTSGTLAANNTYSFSTNFRNETASPTELVTDEIRDEDEAHQVFYIPSGLNLDVMYSDDATERDEDGNPIGLVGTIVTGDASTGTLQVVLRHEPNKGAAGVPAGNIDNAGGETDIEVSFPITIQ